MRHTREPLVQTHRIGWWTHRWWPSLADTRRAVTGRTPDGRVVRRGYFARRATTQMRKLRRPHRPWQAEWEGCRRCPRAFTRAGAERKAARQWAATL